MNPRNKSAAALVSKAGEMGLAVPQIVAHRITRMALAGPLLSERDREEFLGMFVEKQVAFAESWSAMAQEALRANQALSASWASAWMSPFAPDTLQSSTRQIHDAALAVLNKGLAPLHSKAMANSKRLAKTRLR